MFHWRPRILRRNLRHDTCTPNEVHQRGSGKFRITQRLEPKSPKQTMQKFCGFASSGIRHSFIGLRGVIWTKGGGGNTCNMHVYTYTHTRKHLCIQGSAVLGQRFQVLDIEPCIRGAATLPGLIGFKGSLGSLGQLPKLDKARHCKLRLRIVL